MSYTIAELTTILDVNEKTVTRWMDSGLKPVDGGAKPYLIAGSELQVFIKSKNEKRKVELKPHEFFCFGCKRPRRAKRGSKKLMGDKMKGICSVCNGKMSKTIQPSQKYYQESLFQM